MFIFLDKGKLDISDFSLIWSDFFMFLCTEGQVVKLQRLTGVNCSQFMWRTLK